MTDACPLERLAEQRDNAAWSSGVLDLAFCSRLEIVVTLYEHEKATIRPEGWPHAVAAAVSKHLQAWIENNPARAVRAVTYAAPKYAGRQVCVLIVHHAARDGG